MPPREQDDENECEKLLAADRPSGDGGPNTGTGRNSTGIAMMNLCRPLMLLSTSSSSGSNTFTTGTFTTSTTSTTPCLLSGRAVADCVLPRFATVASALPYNTMNGTNGGPQPDPQNTTNHNTNNTTNKPALVSLDPQLRPLTHGQLAAFVQGRHRSEEAPHHQQQQHLDDSNHSLFCLPTFLHAAAWNPRGGGRHTHNTTHSVLRIALILPNGPTLACAIVALSHWATVIPLSHAAPEAELRADLGLCRPHVVLGMLEKDSAHHTATATNNSTNTEDSLAHRVARHLDIPFVELVPSSTTAGLFSLRHHHHPDDDQKNTTELTATTLSGSATWSPSHHDDVVLILFTSGTTGQKKLVPHRWADILVAAATIATSWELQPHDVVINLMPLFHGTKDYRIVRMIVAYVCSFSYCTYYWCGYKKQDTQCLIGFDSHARMLRSTIIYTNNETNIF